jgi:hypothetical protein
VDRGDGLLDSEGGRLAGVPAWRPLDPGRVDCSRLVPGSLALPRRF